MQVLAQQDALVQVSKALRTINAQAGELLESADTVAALKLQQGATPAELTQAGKLVMLTQRIGKSANEFLTSEGASNDGRVPARQGPEPASARSPRA
jgi:twitching motility protein PilJ